MNCFLFYVISRKHPHLSFRIEIIRFKKTAAILIKTKLKQKNKIRFKQEENGMNFCLLKQVHHHRYGMNFKRHRARHLLSLNSFAVKVEREEEERRSHYVINSGEHQRNKQRADIVLARRSRRIVV